MTRGRDFLAGVFLLAGSTAGFGTAEAGTVIRQTVDAQLDKQKVSSDHVWAIDGNKFHLKVSSSSGETQYLFNGKTFYVCGKLDDAQLKQLAGKTGNAKAFEPYRNGACQVVPSNFMARFFLSPMASVESVDASDGLKLTLGLKDYTLAERKAGDGKQGGKACTGFSRGFTVTKTAEEAQSGGITTEVKEEFCHLKGQTWRNGLWTEVAKAVLRQPQGGAIMKQLKKDFTDLPGFVLSADITQTTVDRAGKSHVGSFKLKTGAIEDVEMAPDRFKLPSGYKVFTPESLELLASVEKGAPVEGLKPKKGEASILDVVQSVFFCGLTSRLWCVAE